MSDGRNFFDSSKKKKKMIREYENIQKHSKNYNWPSRLLYDWLFAKLSLDILGNIIR